MRYELIKDGIKNMLRKFEDVDLFFEHNEDVDSSNEYFFVKIMPVISDSISQDVISKEYLIDIRYYHKDFNYLKYMVMAEKVDELIKQGICFGEFYSTCGMVEINISSDEVHIIFKVGITYVVEKEEEGEKMLKLESVLESEGK